MVRKVSSIRKSLKLRSRENGGRKPKSAKRVISRVGKRGGTRKNFGKKMKMKGGEECDENESWYKGKCWPDDDLRDLDDD